MRNRRVGLRKRLALNIFADLHDAKVAEHHLDTLFWECTLRCNLACRHCGSDCRVDPGVADMPLEDFLRVLDEEITPHVDPSEVLIIFSGGEVLVREDLERAGQEVTRRGYPWGMVTNGMALTPRRFRSLLDAGLRSVSVSLDGFEREHNYIRQNPPELRTGVECHPTDRARTLVVVRCGDLCDGGLDSATGALSRDAYRRGGRALAALLDFSDGRAKEDPTLRMTDAQFRALLEFIRQTRREGRIDASYACEGLSGRL